MALQLTTGNTFELSLSRRSLYLRAFGAEMFATFDTPEGSPLLELSSWQIGRGMRLHLGPLMVDAGAS